MAGPGIKGDSLLVEQQNALFKLKGIPSNVSVSTLRKSMALSQGMYGWNILWIMIRGGSGKNYHPGMAVNGSNDMQVLSDSNISAIRNCLSGKNSKKSYQGISRIESFVPAL